MILRIAGTTLELDDNPDPFYEQVVHEIENNYKLDDIPFRKGDFVLDIGAHVGLVSIYLAKKHPGITIHAYEPVPENFALLKHHVRLNNTPNVRPHKLAVTADGRNQEMVRGAHSGGATAFHEHEREPFIVRSTTVPKILKRYGIKNIRLLKLDCEGAEHEILAHANGWLKHVKHIRGELHRVGVAYDARHFSSVVPDVIWMEA